MAGISSVRIELARNGLREVLTGVELEKVLADKARAVQAAAQSRGIKVSGEDGEVPLPIEVSSSARGTSGGRARAAVWIDHPAGLAVEAKHRLLVGSLDAAR